MLSQWGLNQERRNDRGSHLLNSRKLRQWNKSMKKQSRSSRKRCKRIVTKKLNNCELGEKGSNDWVLKLRIQYLLTTI